MIVCYDMETRISTWDYFTWQTHVKLLGATEIVFKTHPVRQTKWNHAEVMRRFENYMKPGPAMHGMNCRIGVDGDRKVGSHQIYDLAADLVRLDCPLPRLRNVVPPAEGVKYTVTIRETFHNVHKNSDRQLWLDFAAVIGAHVIEDTMRTPIGLYERFALYAGAKMNFGVPNGPISTMYFTDYPFRITANPVTTAKGFGGHRIKVGEQIPWLLPNQRIVWEEPTMDGLMRQVEEVERAG